MREIYQNDNWLTIYRILFFLYDPLTSPPIKLITNIVNETISEDEDSNGDERRVLSEIIT